MKVLLLLLIVAASAMAEESVASLDAEIHAMQTKLSEILKLVRKEVTGLECGFELDQIRAYRRELEAARKAGRKEVIPFLEERLREQEEWVAEAMKPRPLFKVIGSTLEKDLDMLEQTIADLRAKRDRLLDAKKAPASELDARIRDQEAKHAHLVKLTRLVCLDAAPFLQRKIAQMDKDIEQARKGENKNAIVRLQALRSEMTKAMDDLTSLSEGVNVEDVAKQVVQVEDELAKLKAEREKLENNDVRGKDGGRSAETLKREIEKREQKLKDIVRVMQTRFRCGNDLDDAKRNLDEARKKLVAANLAEDKDAAKSAEDTIRKVAAFLDEWNKPVIEGVTIETLSEDIHRLKKEKLELEAVLEGLESQAKPKQP